MDVEDYIDWKRVKGQTDFYLPLLMLPTYLLQNLTNQ